MKLSQLLQGVTCAIHQDCEIGQIVNDSRKVQAGDLYVAINGSAMDGHRFASQAIANGAAAVLVEQDLGLAQQVLVADTKQAYATACANFFGNPADDLHLIGVTGTNGKTSVTTMIQDILQHHNMVAGLIGTIHISYAGVEEESKNTTPDAYVMQQTLAKMKAAGCTHVVMEVSSHALAQERLFGMQFDVAAFTNLTQDHLDFHDGMEDYFQAKVKLFHMAKQHIFNIHDPHGMRLSAQFAGGTTFSIAGQDADYQAVNLQCDPSKVTFDLQGAGGTFPVHFAVPGRYSAENAMTALLICKAVGIDLAEAIETVGNIKGINGRCEVLFQNDKMTVIRDYAHSPDGVDNILSSVKEYSKGRVVAVFGCGGDRDRTKRPIMASIAAKHAGFCVVTSDNPRSEDPAAIVAELATGLPDGCDHILIVNRREAIEYAMKNAKQGDTILLLGKGHETYQVLADRTIHFDEKEVVAEIAESL